METQSRSPSPNITAALSARKGSAGLGHRSRSPSPSAAEASPPMTKRNTRRLPMIPPSGGHGVLGTGVAMNSPAKPASLNLAQPKYRDIATIKNTLPVRGSTSPPGSRGSSINFPRLNPSPTRVPRLNIPVPGSISAASSKPLHHNRAPPPGRLGRPEPYSPTERNNLNKISDPPSSWASTMPISHRTSGFAHDAPSWAGHGQGRDLHDSRDLHEGRDSRSLPQPSTRHHSRSPNPGRSFGQNTDHFTAANQQEGGQARRGHSRDGILPNGFKPKGRKPEKYEMRSDSSAVLQEDSDDDDDWC